MRYLPQHQMAPAGTGPKLQTPLRPAPTRLRPRQTLPTLRELTDRAANDTIQGAPPEGLGPKEESPGSKHPCLLQSQEENEAHSHSQPEILLVCLLIPQDRNSEYLREGGRLPHLVVALSTISTCSAIQLQQEESVNTVSRRSQEESPCVMFCGFHNR